MAKRIIAKDGDESLRKRCKDVTVFDDKLWPMLDDMYETMQEANGVGLAAPQISVLRRVDDRFYLYTACPWCNHQYGSCTVYFTCHVYDL